MPIPLALLAAGAAFAGQQVGNSIGQRRNEKNMALQNDYWQSQVNYLEQKNDPARQVAKWRRAGISPQAVFGSSPGGAGLASDSSAPNSDNPNGPASDYGFVQTLAERQRLSNETKVAEAEVKLKDAQAKEAEARATGQANENSIFELIKSAKQSAAGIAALEEKIKGIEAKWLEAEKVKDMEIKDSILRETDQRISNLMSDEAYKKQATEKLRSDMDLIKAQIATESSKQHNLDADTGYKKSLRETEDILRSGRVKIQQTEARKLIEDAFGSRLKNVEIAEQLARIISGADRSSSLYSVLDKAIESIGTREKDEKDNLRNRFLEDLRNFVSLHE